MSRFTGFQCIAFSPATAEAHNFTPSLAHQVYGVPKGAEICEAHSPPSVARCADSRGRPCLWLEPAGRWLSLPAKTRFPLRSRKVLPDQPQRRLDPARRICLGTDLSERRGGRSCTGRPKRHAVRHVERLHAHLDVRLFLDAELLVHVDVELLGRVAPQIIELVVERADV